jgi:hypothetical protein
MEFVIVRFPEIRDVILDGNQCGSTGQKLLVEAGPHTFVLGGLQNYSPPQQEVDVAGTTNANPMEVTFARN